MRVDPSIAGLYAEMDVFVTDYPERTVRRAGAFVSGVAFFPVGAGLGDPGARLPDRPIAIVAHIFDDASYRFAIGTGAGNERIDGNRTWLGLRRLLAIADVDIGACFLTNALMGVKTGAATGAVRGGTFRAQCAAYLARQLAIVRPRLVITLGTHAMAIAAQALPALADAWASANSIGALDARSPAASIVRMVPVAEECFATVAVLRHPCTWTNLPRHGYPGRGLAADAAVLRRALE